MTWIADVSSTAISVRYPAESNEIGVASTHKSAFGKVCIDNRAYARACRPTRNPTHPAIFPVKSRAVTSAHVVA